jgi:hypothetical protein
MNNELTHHGIVGMRWGVRNGPPYPLDRQRQLEVAQNLLNRAFGNITGHYNRNKRNVNLPKNEREAKRQGWRKLSDKASSMHQYHTEGGVRNSKWISPDGHREVVYTGKGKKQHITRDPRDIGTYNYYDPFKHPVGHAVRDVLPYMIAGNNKYDSTTKLSRTTGSVRSFLGKPASKVDTKTTSRGKKRVDKIVNNKKKKKKKER